MKAASKWAKRTAARLRQVDAYVTVYEVEDEKLSELRILRFDRPDEEWLRFVASNRRGNSVVGKWDLICGPVANDQTMPVLSLYLDGMYDEQEAIKRLLPQKLKDQYTFITEKAIRLLKCKEVLRV